jgi:hypothetical protein
MLHAHAFICDGRLAAAISNSHNKVPVVSAIYRYTGYLSALKIVE